MNNFKSKILKFAIIPMFIFCMVFLVGCNMSSQNTVTTISYNMNNLINSINEVELVDNNNLIISDFMDSNNLSLIELESVPRNFLQVNSMNTYLTRLSLLNNAIYHTVQTNNSVNNAKVQLIAKGHQIKSLSDQYQQKNCDICDNCLNALKEASELVNSNLTKVKLTKNEIKNYVTTINEIKSGYNEKIDQLITRYEKLDGGLNTRLVYYINILKGLDAIESLLSSDNCNCNEILKNENDSTLAENTTIPAQTKRSFKNIDTYENAGINGYNKRNNDNNYYNWNNMPYSFGAYNPYMNNRGFGYPQMMPYGFGMGMPYGYGGFTYPNINTYWAYKNIDTYKPNNPNKYNMQEDNDLQLNGDLKNNNLNTNDAITNETFSNGYNKKETKYDDKIKNNDLKITATPNIQDNNEDKFV